jgi:predicted nucleic acid-binding protein
MCHLRLNHHPLCDTNILIEFYRGSAEVTGTLSAIGVSNLAVSVITVGELYFRADIVFRIKSTQTSCRLLF